MQHIIFYSWQGDRPNNTNRGFIKSALEEAVSALAADLTVEPRIDHDTQNVPGSPDIARTILKKIETTDIFVADVTVINEPEAMRPTPNPNVLLELGYAMHSLGEDRIILVFNEHFGPVEKLPFDLRARRTVIYNVSPDAGEKAPERHRLAAILKAAIKTAIDTIHKAPPSPDTKEIARNAIESGAPNRAILVRNAMREITSELERNAPPQFRSGGTVEQLLTSIADSAPAVREFTQLAQVIASMNDSEAARALWKNLSRILEHYNNPRGSSRQFDERDFDYWRFLGQELITTAVATLLSEERYAIIQNLLDETITVTNQRYQSGSAPVAYEYASEYVRALKEPGDVRQRLSLHADILHERHGNAGDNGLTEDGPLADVLPFSQLMAADYLLWLRGELAPELAPTGSFKWYPYTSVYLRDPPEFVLNAIRVATATALANALNVPDVPALKDRLQERAGRLVGMWERGAGRQPIRQEHIDRIGTRP